MTLMYVKEPITPVSFFDAIKTGWNITIDSWDWLVIGSNPDHYRCFSFNLTELN